MLEPFLSNRWECGVWSTSRCGGGGSLYLFCDVVLFVAIQTLMVFVACATQQLPNVGWDGEDFVMQNESQRN